MTVREKVIKKPTKTASSVSKVRPKEKAAEERISINKKYTKANSCCKVTFRLPREAVAGVQTVTLVGDFNNWDEKATPLKKLKNGEFKIVLDLPSGNTYRFRYLLNGCNWENDWAADRYAPNPYGCEDSVVIV